MTCGLRGMLIASMIGLGTTCGVRPALTQQIATTPVRGQWQDYIAEASRRFGLPAAWIRAVMRAESGGDPRALSPKGAIGLMQLVPATWAELRARYGLGIDPYDPHDNILAGAAYLRELYDRYGYPNLFAAYNAGPERFDADLFSGRPLPDETLAYLARLGQPTFESQSTSVVASGTSLFFPLSIANRTLPNSPSSPSSNGLFVPLTRASDRKP